MNKRVAILFLILFVFPLNLMGKREVKRLTWNSGKSYSPDITIDLNDHIHVVYQDNTLENFEIYHKKSEDGGKTWTTRRLTQSFTWSEDPTITVDRNNHIHVVYFEYSIGDYEIYAKKSKNGGVDWSTRKLAQSPVPPEEKTTAVDSNNHIHEVWEDNESGNYEIFYKISKDRRKSWKSKRLTWNSGCSRSPAIALDSNNHVYVVWEDNTSGNYEIYFMKFNIN